MCELIGVREGERGRGSGDFLLRGVGRLLIKQLPADALLWGYIAAGNERSRRLVEALGVELGAPVPGLPFVTAAYRRAGG